MTREEHQKILYGSHFGGLDAPLINMPFHYKRPSRGNIFVILRLGRFIAQIDGIDLDNIFYSRQENKS